MKNNQCFKPLNKRQALVYSLKYVIFLLVIFVLLLRCTHNNETKIVLGTFTINTGDYDRFDTPIRFECQLTELFGEIFNFRDSLHNYQFMLKEEGSRESSILAQWVPKAKFDWEQKTDQGTLIWILNGETKKNSIRNFILILEKWESSESPFSIEDINKKSLLIKNDSKPILQYNYGIIREKEGKINPFDRSSYIHPVWTPTGKIITGDFSPEHIYQRGIFKAWRKVKFEGFTTEFWSIGLDLYDTPAKTQKDDRNIDISNGPVFTQIVVYNNGIVGNDKTYCKEICTVRIYNRLRQNTWMFDLIVREIPVDPDHPETLPRKIKTMELEEIHYGGMSFRGASPEWLRQERISREDERFSKDNVCLSPEDSLDILTSEGHNRKTGNGIPARWIDYTGPLGDEWGGLVVFDHPSNVRYPTPLRIHPYLPYFSYALTKDAPYTITSEAPLNLMYRFVVHNGHPDKKFNEKIAQDFVAPPQVTWNQTK